MEGAYTKSGAARSSRLKSAGNPRKAHRLSLPVVSSIVLQNQLIILWNFEAPYTLQKIYQSVAVNGGRHDNSGNRTGRLTPLVLANDGGFPLGEGISMDSRRVYGSVETGFDAGVGETIDGLRPCRSRTSFIPLILLPRSGSSSKRGLRGRPCWTGEGDDDAPELPVPGPDRPVRTRCVRFDTGEGNTFGVVPCVASAEDGVSATPCACGAWTWRRLDARDLRDPTRETCTPAWSCGGGAFTEVGVWPAEGAP